jgi:xylulose-5-phosphate/fructose-6-phosphate phosphoketolase
MVKAPSTAKAAIVAPTEADAAGLTEALSSAELALMDAWWRAAANYLSVGPIYLLDNPLLQEPLELKHI